MIVGINASMKALSRKNLNGRIVPVLRNVQIILSHPVPSHWSQYPTFTPALSNTFTTHPHVLTPHPNHPHLGATRLSHLFRFKLKKAEISIGGSVPFKSHNIYFKNKDARCEEGKGKEVPTGG